MSSLPSIWNGTWPSLLLLLLLLPSLPTSFPAVLLAALLAGRLLPLPVTPPPPPPLLMLLLAMLLLKRFEIPGDGSLGGCEAEGALSSYGSVQPDCGLPASLHTCGG